MLFNAPESGDTGGHRAGTLGADDSARELARLRERERQMLELLGSKSPDRLVHDLRNLLNEVQLLRLVIDDKT